MLVAFLCKGGNIIHDIVNDISLARFISFSDNDGMMNFIGWKREIFEVVLTLRIIISQYTFFHDAKSNARKLISCVSIGRNSLFH